MTAPVTAADRDIAESVNPDCVCRTYGGRRAWCLGCNRIAQALANQRAAGFRAGAAEMQRRAIFEADRWDAFQVRMVIAALPLPTEGG